MYNVFLVLIFRAGDDFHLGLPFSGDLWPPRCVKKFPGYFGELGKNGKYQLSCSDLIILLSMASGNQKP